MFGIVWPSDYLPFGLFNWRIFSLCNCFTLRCSHFATNHYCLALDRFVFFQSQFCRIGWTEFCPFFAFESGFVYYRLKIFSLIFSELRLNVKKYLYLNFDRRNLVEQSGSISHNFHSIN